MMREEGVEGGKTHRREDSIHFVDLGREQNQQNRNTVST